VDSAAGLLSDSVAEVAMKLGFGGTPVFTYLANNILVNGREVPYSLIAARPDVASGIVLNEWAARDTGAKIGDAVKIEYYVWREPGRLVTESAEFRVSGFTATEGGLGDKGPVPRDSEGIHSAR
jgi:hypothetical protein